TAAESLPRDVTEHQVGDLRHRVHEREVEEQLQVAHRPPIRLPRFVGVGLAAGRSPGGVAVIDRHRRPVLMIVGCSCSRPYSCGRSAPTYPRASRVEARSTSSGSVLTLAQPSIRTNAYGGRSSSMHNPTRGSRSTARPLTDLDPVVISRSSPSRTNHTGTTCGRPWRRVVAHLAVRVPAVTKSRYSVSDIAGMTTSGARSRVRCRHRHASQQSRLCLLVGTSLS